MAAINSSAADAHEAAPAFHAARAASGITMARSLRDADLQTAKESVRHAARSLALSPPAFLSTTPLRAATKVASTASPPPTSAALLTSWGALSRNSLLLDTSFANACASLLRVDGLRAGCMLLAKVREPSTERSASVTTCIKLGLGFRV
jgi:hypothetical protein